jgi:hypothetical protein
MPQEDVTKNAPNWIEESGIAEYRKQQDKERAVEESNDQYNKDKEIARKAIDDLGIVESDMQATAETVMARQDPFSATGLEDEYTRDETEYDQGFWADTAAGLWNGLVVGGGEGLANLAPTVLQALGADNEFLDSWSSGVTNFFDNQRMIYSDAADEEIEGFSDINSAHVGRALGQGIGFLAGIIGTGGTLGVVSKGGRLLSRAAKIEKGLRAAVDGAEGAAKIAALKRLESFTSKAAKAIEKANKGQEWASRVGTFMAGTTLMYPEVLKEAKRAGLNNTAAARFALGVSGLVSMTEGAALEWIGKAASKPFTKAIANKNVREALLTGTKDPIALKKIFTEGYSKAISKGALRNKAGIVAEGAAIEFGQEFSQTYIEEGAKQLYDTIYKGQGKGEFGADVTTYKSFVESVFGGLIGAVLGGGMAFMQSGQGLGDQLTKEGLFNYINNSVEQGKSTKKIGELKSGIEELVQKGKMTKSEASSALGLIDELQVFSENVKTSDLKDGVTKFQLFQLDRARRNADTVASKINPENTTNPVLQEEAKGKISMIETVKGAINDNFKRIFESKEKETDDKGEFDNKIKLYDQLLSDIAQGKVSKDDLQERLTEIDNAVTIAPQQDAETFVINGVEMPVAIAENTEAIQEIKDLFDQVDQNKITSEEFYQQMKDKYNLSEDQINQIIDENFLKNYEELKTKKGSEEGGEKEGGKKIKPEKKATKTLEEQEQELEELTQKEKEIQDQLDSLEISDEQKDLEKELAEAKEKVEQAETNSEKAKARKEFKEASKKLRDFKTEEGKKSKEEKQAAKDKLINELNKITAQKDELGKKVKLEQERRKQRKEKAEKSKPKDEVKDAKEFLQTQKDALGMLESRGERLEKDLSEAKDKAEKQKIKKQIDANKKKVAKLKKEIQEAEVKSETQILEEAEYDKKSIKELESTRDELQQRLDNLGDTPDLFELSELKNRIKSLSAEIKRKKVEEAKAKAKSKVDTSAKIGTQVGKKVKWKGKEYTISKEGVRYILENETDIVELEATDNSTLSELGLTPVVKTKSKSKKSQKRKYTNATEEGITINGIDYVYVLDENGSVIELVPVEGQVDSKTGKPYNRISTEEVLIRAEIERNKLDNNSHTEEEIENFTPEDSVEEKIFEIGSEKYTDSVHTALEKLNSDVPEGMFELTEAERKETNEWVEDAMQKTYEEFEQNPSIKLEEFYAHLDTIKTRLDEEAEQQRRTKKDSIDGKKKDKTKRRSKQRKDGKIRKKSKVEIENQTSLEEEFDAIDRAAELGDQIEAKANELQRTAETIQEIEDFNADTTTIEYAVNEAWEPVSPKR